MIELLKISEITDSLEREEVVHQVRFIFYASSSLKEFSTPERKVAFFKRWCGDYLTYFSEYFFIMREDKKVLGYLTGCLDSSSALSLLEIPGYSHYSDLFQTYPAHFHINFHPDCRGRGLGSQLVEAFCNDLVNLKIKGVHLVTSRGAKNIVFYRRLGFVDEFPRDFNEMTLLFMGRILELNTLLPAN